MITISTLMFILAVELLVILILTLLLWGFFTLRAKRRDRAAVRQLVSQIMHQSKTRQQETNSFLHEKYRFQGDELNKAVEAIDKSEKKFIQKFINIYLQRDAQALSALDAGLAEVVDTYKNLTPIMADAESLQQRETVESVKADAAKQVEQARQETERLSEELSITKQTMTNMIAEFGNMFGGGAGHELAKHEVIKKMQESTSQAEPAQAAESEPETVAIAKHRDNRNAPASNAGVDTAAQPAADQAEVVEQAAISDDNANSDQQKTNTGQIVSEDDIENLLNDIELTAEK